MHTREDYLRALGPLAALYTDRAVTEIMVDSPERILVEIDGQLQQTEILFDTVDEILKVIRALAELSGEPLQPEQTLVDFSFPEGEARGLAVLPPTALNGPVIVIYKMMKTGWITWEKLVEWGSVTPEGLEFLRQAVRTPVNILVAGGTNSGKTTIANRIAELIPPEQRVIVVESIHEIQVQHPRLVYLQGGGPGKVVFEDLIQASTRMRPDWLVLGEMRGAEAMRAVEVFSRGHTGITNIHAESAEDALGRLEALCLTANLGLGLGEIRSLVSAAFQLVVYQRRMPDGKRKIIDIAELRGLEGGRYRLERLFRLNLETNRLEATGVKPAWAGAGI